VYIDDFSKSQNQLVQFQLGMLQHGQSQEMFEMNVRNLKRAIEKNQQEKDQATIQAQYQVKLWQAEAEAAKAPNPIRGEEEIEREKKQLQERREEYDRQAEVLTNMNKFIEAKDKEIQGLKDRLKAYDELGRRGAGVY
jgi:hypothetical protein